VNRVLVIGSTGRVGREVVGQLHARDAEVSALAGNPDAANFPSEVEVVRGDLGCSREPGRVPGWHRRGLPGVDRPAGHGCPGFGADCKVRTWIVLLSAPLKTSHPLFQQPNPARALSEQIERLIETSGLE